MIDEILPAEVAAVETCTDVAGARLFPEEAAAMSGAAGPRRTEYATARWCARAALAQLAVPEAPILHGPHGEPLWPVTTTGSITHCPGYRACAVALDRHVAAIGIDAEPHRPLPSGLLDAIAFAGERSLLAERMAAAPGLCWDRLLFSAKESVFKAWFSHAGRLLRFEDAAISFDQASHRFSAHLLAEDSSGDERRRHALEGRWLVGNGLIITAVTIPPDAATAPSSPTADAAGHWE